MAEKSHSNQQKKPRIRKASSKKKDSTPTDEPRSFGQYFFYTIYVIVICLCIKYPTQIFFFDYIDPNYEEYDSMKTFYRFMTQQFTIQFLLWGGAYISYVEKKRSKIFQVVWDIFVFDFMLLTLWTFVSSIIAFIGWIGRLFTKR